MAQFDHENVVKMEGVVTKSKYPFFMLVGDIRLYNN